MKVKLLRLLARDHQTVLRVIVIAGLILLLPMLGIKLKLQAGQLKRLEEKKQLIVQIPAMERRLKAIKWSPKSLDFALDGVVIKDGISSVVSADKIYSEGETAGRYTILKITSDSVILGDNVTKERREVFLNGKK